MHLRAFLRLLPLPVVVVSLAVAAWSVTLDQPSSLSASAVVGVGEGLCKKVKPDPLTGQRMVYCCLDEIFALQKEGDVAELRTFLTRLTEIQAMPLDEAQTAFEAPYDGIVHRKYGWNTLCGQQVPCEMCRMGPRCGNGIVEADEECDDGFNNSNLIPNSCRVDCHRSRCGDGIIDSGEQCDNGAENSDTTSNACRTTCILPRCGDSVVDPGEFCDDGPNNADLPDHCRVTCRTAICNDGVIDSNEQCDAGASNANLPNQCRTTCKLPVCGDGIRDTSEECDDGNALNRDGCSAQCALEAGTIGLPPTMAPEGTSSAASLLPPTADSASSAAALVAAPPPPHEPIIATLPTFNEIPDPSDPFVFPSAPAEPTEPSGTEGGASELFATLSAWQPVQTYGPVIAETGPGILMVFAAGSAAGFAWVRRKRK